MNADRLMNECLREHKYGRALAEIMAAALTAVDPASAVRNNLRCTGDNLIVGDCTFNLKSHSRVLLAGAGKAGAPMAAAAMEILNRRVDAGVVIVKDGHRAAEEERFERIELIEAAHPVPDERNVRAAKKLADLVCEAQADDIVIVLLSGGGSALLTLPAANLTLADVQSLTTELLKCGADIKEINAVRKHCLRLAGGGLAQLAAPAQVATLVLSDVIGSPLDVIASGATAPDPTTYRDAWAVIKRYNLEARLPRDIVAHLQRGVGGEVAETPKPEDELWRRVHNQIIASNRTAAEAAVAAASARGFDAQLLTAYLEGEAREVGRVAAGIAREVANKRESSARPQLIVCGGETTVTLRGRGHGGRNQELALGAVEGLAEVEDAIIITLATDGGDGPTDAAGAVVTGATFHAAKKRNLNPHDFLQRNDAYNFFAPLGALLRPGPTLTNVNDLLFICAG